jgi:hypothetical protein
MFSSINVSALQVIGSFSGFLEKYSALSESFKILINSRIRHFQSTPGLAARSGLAIAVAFSMETEQMPM